MSRVNPWLPFYPSDWLGDEKLQLCSLATCGLWVYLLSLMHKGEPYGHLRVAGLVLGPAEVASMTGKPVAEIKKSWKELVDRGVPDVVDGCLVSRRMVRDQKERIEKASAGRSGGSPNLGIEYNLPGFVYAAQRSSDQAIKIGFSAAPAKRLYKIRQQFPGVEIHLAAQCPTTNMGALEAALHAELRAFSLNGSEWFALPEDARKELIRLMGDGEILLKANIKAIAKATPHAHASAIPIARTLGVGLLSFEKSDEDESSDFDRFWAAWPKKRREVNAQRSFLACSNRRPPIAELVANVEAWAASAEWQREGGRFVPDAAAWLDGARWREQPPPTGYGAAPVRSLSQARQFAWPEVHQAGADGRIDNATVELLIARVDACSTAEQVDAVLAELPQGSPQ